MSYKMTAKLRELTGAIQEQESQTNCIVLEIGQLLTEGKEDLDVTQGCKGEFAGWIADNFSFSVRTAYHRIDAYRVFGEVDCETVKRFHTSALYLLAGSAVPTEIQQESIALAEGGKQVTKKVAQSLIDKHKAKMEKAKKAERERELTEAKERVTIAEDTLQAVEKQKKPAAAEKARQALMIAEAGLTNVKTRQAKKRAAEEKPKKTIRYGKVIRGVEIVVSALPNTRLVEAMEQALAEIRTEELEENTIEAESSAVAA